MSGWPMLVVAIALYVLCPVLIYFAFVDGPTSASGGAVPEWWLFGGGIVVLAAAIILSPGFFTLQPNEARVLILFGDYKGTAAKRAASTGSKPVLRQRATASRGGGSIAAGLRGQEELRGAAGPVRPQKPQAVQGQPAGADPNGDRLKVNDKRGNPVDIAAVVVWRVDDTAKAVFDVDDFESYVAMQSETAVRHLASAYPYDTGETFADTDDETTLRGNVDEVSEALRVELTERLAQAGVIVEQARLSHLAYSPRSPRRCSAASRQRRSSRRGARSSPAP